MRQKVFYLLGVALLAFYPFNVSSGVNKLIVVSVIDTGLNLKDARFKNTLCKFGHADLTNEGISDVIGHGTHVTGIIRGFGGDPNLGPGYCIVVIKYYSAFGQGMINHLNMLRAMRLAIELNSNIINISSEGKGSDREEKYLISANKDIKWIVAAGNDGTDLDVAGNETYPCYYNSDNLTCVGSIDRSGKLAEGSNFGSKLVYEVGVNVISTLPNNMIGYMSGTSMSTATKTGKWIYEQTHKH